VEKKSGKGGGVIAQKKGGLLPPSVGSGDVGEEVGGRESCSKPKERAVFLNPPKGVNLFNSKKGGGGPLQKSK